MGSRFGPYTLTPAIWKPRRQDSDIDLKTGGNKMVTKTYAFGWLITVASAALFYLLGAPSDLVLTIYGFAVATLLFMGIVFVLPWWVDKNFSWDYQTR
jgi:hypothetical protein